MFVCSLVAFASYYDESYKAVGVNKKYKYETNIPNRSVCYFIDISLAIRYV